MKNIYKKYWEFRCGSPDRKRGKLDFARKYCYNTGSDLISEAEVESNLTQMSEVVVVGAAAEKFSRNVANWLQSREIRFVPAENVYSATAVIGQIDSHLKVLVIGTFEELSKEGMRFFDIAAARGNVTCICLEQNTRDCDIIKTAIAEKPAVSAISRLDDLKILLFQEPEPDKNDYLLSEEELSALSEIK